MIINRDRVLHVYMSLLYLLLEWKYLTYQINRDHDLFCLLFSLVLMYNLPKRHEELSDRFIELKQDFWLNGKKGSLQ